MPSIQSQLVKIVFQFRRTLHPPKGVLDIEKARAETEELARYFKTKIKFRSTPVDVNQIPAEWVATPETSAEKVILYFHGGSYNSGSIQSHRSLVANIAHAAKARGLIIDYRLAPEHPFPAAVEDAITAYRWLLEESYAPGKIVIAGDSAGGGLVLALLIGLRDAGEPLPAAAVCLSPWTDLTCTGESWKTNSRKDFLLDPAFEIKSAKLYVGDADLRNPLASPLYADLHGLPPLLIQVGSDELILSDSTCLAERAQAAGVDMTLEVWDGMQHEWQFAASYLPESRQAIQRIGQFVSEHLGPIKHEHRVPE